MVRLPVTWSEPVIDAGGQLRATAVGLSTPLTVKHEELTFHVPTGLPPHPVAFEQDADAPPVPVVPPVAVAAPPPVPVVFELELPQAITATDNPVTETTRRKHALEAATDLSMPVFVART
jgi:hypothetical protein